MTAKIPHHAALNSLSLTPLIDVVLLLLIFFLVASRFAREERQLNVVLPQASEAKPMIAAPAELFVNIDKEGRFFVDGSNLELHDVEALLRQAAANNPLNQTVIIRADRRVQFDRVVAVMNACNKAGVRRYKVTTAAPS